jgi:hypothetical protein
MNRTLPLLLICTLCLTACVSDTGPAARHCDRTQPTRDEWHPPTYPSAQQLQDNREGNTGKITFITPDAPEKVTAAYVDALKKQGWQYDDYYTPTPDDQHFIIPNCCYYGSLHVTARAADDGLTTVTLIISWGMGCG